MSQDQGINQKKSINLGGVLLDLGVPRVMGILNLTPDSFYDGGQYTAADAALHHAGNMLEAGADIIDVGGASSRPGSAEIPQEEELQRILPVIRALVKEFPGIKISADTYRAAVAHQVLDAGACMINDISGGADAAMFATLARWRVPYVLMHMPGTPATMHTVPQYTDMVGEVAAYLGDRIEALELAGVNDIILDPGFGFGKTREGNYRLLRHLDTFCRVFGLPVLAGVSRKSMISGVTGTTAAGALAGTLTAHTLALQNGASILRVHDVAAAVEGVKLYQFYRAMR